LLINSSFSSPTPSNFISAVLIFWQHALTHLHIFVAHASTLNLLSLLHPLPCLMLFAHYVFILIFYLFICSDQIIFNFTALLSLCCFAAVIIMDFKQLLFCEVGL
jgi:hypothetical protein